MSKNTQSNKAVITIIAAAAVILIAVAVAVSVYNTPTNRLHRKVDLGNKYLEEQNYEQAAIEFEQAIEIDECCVEAYAGGIEAYLGADDIDGAKDLYDRTLTMLDGLDADTLASNVDYVVEINLAAEMVYADDRDMIARILQEGYAKTGDERLQAKIEELEELQAQEDAEKERLLAEETAKQKELEEAERQRELEEEAARQKELEEEERQKELEETEGQDEVEEGAEETSEETPEPEQKEETPQTTTPSSTVEAYQAKAAEYIYNKETENIWDLRDVRYLKTLDEFIEYFSSEHNVGFYMGAVNTSLMEETENQYKIMVTSMYHYTEQDDAYILYYEVTIDKDTKLGIITNYYWERIKLYYDPYYDDGPEVVGTVLQRSSETYLFGNCYEWVIDLSK